MQGDALEEWRRAEAEAVRAEEALRAAVAPRSAGSRAAAADARALRNRANELWREFLGSSLGALAPASPPAPSADQATVGETDRTALNLRIDEWRRAQARAHVAEVRAVHAYTRSVAGGAEEQPSDLQVEASLLRHEAARRLQRVYDAAAAAGGAGPN